MNREQMVAQAFRSIHQFTACGCDGDPTGHVMEVHMATEVLDAILPQVSTVEELDALPAETLVVAADGYIYRRRRSSVWTWYCMSNGFDYRSSDVLDGPALTVVWQP